MLSTDRYEIRFSGSGGQGIITAAIVLAEAIGTKTKNYVSQTQSYGPEARGGTSRAEVVVSPSPIDYPKAIRPDLLLAMNQASCDAYFSDLKPEGLLVTDATLVDQVPTARVVAIPFTEIAISQAGRKVVANMVALGAVVQLTQIVSSKSMEAALLTKVPKGTEEMNTKAFRAGVRAAKKFNLDALPPTVTPEDEEV
jgi:2-oxoglutarate ferredoxin oxidoreductase subunit gamma